MSKLNISLPEPIKAFVEEQVKSGQYSSVSDYICDLILYEQRRLADAEVEAKLLEALDSGDYQEVTPEFFDRLRARVHNKKNAAINHSK
jgi:antitoxin ParD1/3/4